MEKNYEKGANLLKELKNFGKKQNSNKSVQNYEKRTK